MSEGRPRRRWLRLAIGLYLLIGLAEVVVSNTLNTDPDGRLTLAMLLDPNVALGYKAVLLLGNAFLLLVWPVTLPSLIARWT